MKVSVILPTYNRANMLTEAIDSALNQTFKDFELIIINNYSTDNTESVVKSYDDKRIRYFKNRNNGLVSVNRNYGIQKSRGEYTAFLDDDDLWLPEKLEKQVKLLDSNKELGLVYSGSHVIDNKGNLIRHTYFRGIKPCRGDVFNELLVSNFIPQLTVLVRRETLDKVGKFDTKYKIAQDYDLWLRIAAHYQVDFIDQPLAKYRFHKDGASQKEMIRSFQEEILAKECWLNKDQSLRKEIGGRIKRRKTLLYSGMILMSGVNIFKEHNIKSIRAFWDLVKYLARAKT
ncbi:MAG: glycosyl transferase family 2 [Dehalococcoidales bacterium]|nr:glycosyl transferase family 2 [Dehalococcoidales bacterium]|tara:strand:+ start:2638 stop:3498 length:861 start_codon:yes stop_codon:yes gene_type:complete